MRPTAAERDGLPRKIKDPAPRAVFDSVASAAVHAEAICLCADASESGDGVAKNLAFAAGYLERAASAGHVGVMIRYADALENGRGVQHNLDMAMDYVRHAANAGDGL
jgi:TPR repeat protein